MAIKVICRQNQSRWHRWFAWHPVCFDRELKGERVCYTHAWWAYVERRRDRWSDWEYRRADADAQRP